MYYNEIMVDKQGFFQKEELSSKFISLYNNEIMVNKQGVFEKVELSSKFSLCITMILW